LRLIDPLSSRANYRQAGHQIGQPGGKRKPVVDIDLTPKKIDDTL